MAVVGGKHSGKTTTIENLTIELRCRGYHVGAIKEMVRIPALDTPGKETDRYAQAGAEIIVAVPRNETVVFLKRRLELGEIIPFFRGLDFVLLEGFEDKRALQKVIVAKTIMEVQSYLDESTIAVSGLLAESAAKAWNFNVPLLSCRTQIKQLTDLVEQKTLNTIPNPINK